MKNISRIHDEQLEVFHLVTPDPYNVKRRNAKNNHGKENREVREYLPTHSESATGRAVVQTE